MPSHDYTDLVDMFERSVARHGHKRALGTRRRGIWTWTTYAELGALVDRARAGLAALGVGRGDAVAVLSRNRLEWAVLAYAVYGLGARLVPMYENQREQDWRYIAHDSEARVMVVSTPAIHAAVRGWVGEVGKLERVLCMGLPETHDQSMDALMQRGATRPVPVVPVEPGDICGFIYTSGTTGQPKGVLLSHGNIISNVNATQEFAPMVQDDVSLSFLPWAHSFGQTCELHCMVAMGCAVAVAESTERLAANLLEVRPTVLFAVPRVFTTIYDAAHKRIESRGGLTRRLFHAALANAAERRRLKDAGRTSLAVEAQHRLYDRLVFSRVRERFGGRLRFAFSGGAALSPEVATFIDDLGIAVIEGYGLTETSPIACANRPGDRRIGSVGKPLAGVEVRIDPGAIEAGAAPGEGSQPARVGPDVEGEILIKGPNVMQGYHKLPEATAAVMTADGAFRTGDRGRIDADGFLWITGRIKELYKLENGKYVAPGPLEEKLALSPLIDQVFIYGDGRPHNVALVLPDRDGVMAWAQGQGVTGSWPQVIADPRTRAMICGEVETQGRDFKPYEAPRAVELLEEGFTIENGMMTPKMSIRRGVVEERMRARIEALYREPSR